LRSEVKGIWFVTARRYVLQEHGDDVLHRFLAGVPAIWREEVADPIASRWYPEDMLRDSLEVFHAVVANGEDAAFSRAIERCSVLGVHWFVQMLVSIATPAYLLRLMPTTLALTRRGPVRVTVQVGEAAEKKATLRFTGQPYATDPRYMLSTPAIIRGVVGLCVGPTVTAELSYVDASTHVCDVRW
jgi:hypothetical protein